MADYLAKLASSQEAPPPGVFVENISRPTIQHDDDDPETHPESSASEGDSAATTSGPDPAVLTVEPDWCTPFTDYLQYEKLLEDQTEARRLARRAKSFVVKDGELYRRSISGILQRCIPSNQGRDLLLDIHKGIYDHHAALRSLVDKAYRQGFYWLTTVADVQRLVRAYWGCQYFT